MSQALQSYLFFLKCPDLRKLISFTAEITDTNVKRKGLSSFHRRILKCRELLFSEVELLATPAFFSRTEILVVMPIKRFYTSEFQNKLNKMELRIIRTDDTLPAHLQECLHYTATAKLAPQWNSVQDLLIQGRDFLMVSDSLRAIKLDIFVDGSEIVLSVIPKCIKLPPFRVETYSKLYDLSEKAISIQETVHVLPSLKKGKAVYLSKNILTKKAFKDYSEIKKHWKNMYGYRLPEIPEEEIWYLNVEFNVPFSTSYTYPVFCAKPFGMTEILRVDPHLTLQSFMNDFCKKVHNICQEKCQIMDTRASFPSLQLYRIDEIKDLFPRPGTTYTKIQNIPYRNSVVNQVNDGKIMSNSVNSMSQARDRRSSLLSEKRRNVEANNFSCATEKISNKEKNSETLGNILLKNVSEHPNFTSSNSDSATNAKLLSLDKNVSDSVSKITTISKNPLEAQQKYAPRFFPKKSKGKMLHSPVNGALQTNLNQAMKPREKYAPRFIPKQPKQNSTLITEKSVPKLKAAVHMPKLSVDNARNIPLQQSTENYTGITYQNSHLKLTPDKFKKSAVVRKIKTPRMNSKKEFGRKDECSQGEVTKGKQKNVNSRKWMNDDDDYDDDFLSSKGNKTKKSKINKTVKGLTSKVK